MASRATPTSIPINEYGIVLIATGSLLANKPIHDFSVVSIPLKGYHLSFSARLYDCIISHTQALLHKNPLQNEACRFRGK